MNEHTDGLKKRLMNYKVIIGLEVHVELKTNSKMFCRCSAQYFGEKPNTHTCPVCLGLPGALPVPNRQAIEWCVKIGQALNCTIPLFSKFDRKNYFYPDLPKGYQISQYDKPFCVNGQIEINGKKIGIRRVHMEEDTGKLNHQGNTSLIDFNRSGVPLVEIVTEPDFDNAKDVKTYLQKLQQIVRYLGVSDADMEKGQMRLEPNISVSLDIDSKGLPKYKVEVKNINSFSFVEKAINFEIERQLEILKSGQTPAQETRGWNEVKSATVSQRLKEEANDYRYFPEPDIPPIRWTKEKIGELKSEIPELPDLKLIRFQKEYQLSVYDADILTKYKPLADYFEEAVRVAGKQSDPKEIANYIINRKPSIEDFEPSKLIQLIMLSTTVTIDDATIDKAITEVLRENSKMVEDYKKGKVNVLSALAGKVRYRFPNENIDMIIVIEKLKKLILEELK